MEKRDYRRIDWVQDGHYDAGIVRIGRVGIPGSYVILTVIFLAVATCGGAGIAASVIGETHIVHWIPALALAGIPILFFIVWGVSTMVKAMYRGFREDVSNATRRLEDSRNRSSSSSYDYY